MIMLTFGNVMFIAQVEMEVRGASGGERVSEKGLGRVELERLSGIGDSDDPVAKFQQPQHQRPPEKPSPAQNDARLRVLQIHEPVVHHRHLLLFPLDWPRATEK